MCAARITHFCLAALLTLLSIPQATYAADAAPVTRAKDRADVESRLRAGHPFYQLSQAGQNAFLDSMQFWSGGLRAFDATPLQLELSRSDMETLMDSLGIPEWKQQPFVRSAPSMANTALKNSGDILARVYQLSLDFTKARAANPLVARQWHVDEFPLRFKNWLDRPVQTLSDGDLIALHHAAHMSAFMAESEMLEQKRLVLLQEKVRRDMASEREIRNAHEGLLAARLYPDADQLATQHHQLALPPAPVIVDELPAGATGPTILHLDANGTLRRRPRALDQGLRLAAPRKIAHKNK